MNGAFGQHLEQGPETREPFAQHGLGAALRLPTGEARRRSTCRATSRRARDRCTRVNLGEVSEELGSESVVTSRERLHLDVKGIVGDGVELVVRGAG